MLNMIMFSVIFTVVQIVGYSIVTKVMVNKFTDPEFMKKYMKKYLKCIEQITEDEDLDL